MFAIGNPFGLDQSLSAGIISAVDRNFKSVTGIKTTEELWLEKCFSLLCRAQTFLKEKSAVSLLFSSLPPGRTINNVIQSDAAINPGNSGGALLDSKGKLIGVNTAIFSRSG